MIINTFTRIFLILTLTLSIAHGQEVSQQFEDWQFYQEDKASRCLIYTTGRTTDNTFEDTPTYFYIRRVGPNQYSIGVTGLDARYENAIMILDVDSRSYLLNVKNEEYGWSFSSKEDIAIINALSEAEEKLQIKTYWLKNKSTLNKFSLNGFDSAFKKLISCRN